MYTHMEKIFLMKNQQWPICSKIIWQNGSWIYIAFFYTVI